MSIDPMAFGFTSHTPYNYTFNNPINYIDPNGATGEPIINEKEKTITIKSVLWVYGGAANQERAEAIATSIQNQWNTANGKIKIGDIEYSVVFEVTGIFVSERAAEFIFSGKSDMKLSAKDNFVRLEENGRDKWSGNSGFLSWESFKASSTTAGHEYGHGLGWLDQTQSNSTKSLNGRHDNVGNVIKGLRVPGIMTPLKNMYLSDFENPEVTYEGPLPMANQNAFDSKTKALDPDVRKVMQRDVEIIMKGYNPGTTKKIGSSYPYLFNADGNEKK